ncbi:hypothetical protein ROZALSC1DRAFT_21085 [Rozella allomycis CSF55]|uniref:Cell morphogenesis protein N-terminal domain-containing protein n=1 Tax=Rozella allomycis (strain CSF55) TaxID=988480 RepID=A0A4P9YM78_ROZAC|nr:hypothetical protein ROZALSC1DRAFT_21085 [Rozella allomycis CSF55]
MSMYAVYFDQMMTKFKVSIDPILERLIMGPIEMPIETLRDQFKLGGTSSDIIDIVSSFSEVSPELVVECLMSWRKHKSDVLENVINRRLMDIDFSEYQKQTGGHGIFTDSLYESLFNSPFRTLNFDLFGELLGAMTSTRLTAISDRFIAEFEKSEDLKDPKYDYLAYGLKYFRLKSYPPEAFEEATWFVLSICENIKRCQNIKTKQHLIQFLSFLLIPIIETAESEFNFPGWSKSIEGVLGCIQSILPKVNTRREYFEGEWIGVIDICVSKLKDKTMKDEAMLMIIQIVWVYLNRVREIPNLVKVESIIKQKVPPGKRHLNPLDVNLKYLSIFVEIIGRRVPEFCMTHLVNNLLNVENVNNVGVERIIVAMESLRGIVEGIVKGNKSIFPRRDVIKSPCGYKRNESSKIESRREFEEEKRMESKLETELEREDLKFHNLDLSRIDEYLGNLLPLIEKLSESENEILMWNSMFNLIPFIYPTKNDFILMQIGCKFVGQLNNQQSRVVIEMFKRIKERVKGNNLIHVINNYLQTYFDKEMVLIIYKRFQNCYENISLNNEATLKSGIFSSMKSTSSSSTSTSGENDEMIVQMIYYFTILSKLNFEEKMIRNCIRIINSFLFHDKSAIRMMICQSFSVSEIYEIVFEEIATLIDSILDDVRRKNIKGNVIKMQQILTLMSTGEFRAMKEWSGYGEFRDSTREKEVKMMSMILEQVKDIVERGILTNKMEEQRKALEDNAILAMVSLINGPLQLIDEKGIGKDSFNIAGVMNWIESLLNNAEERINELGIQTIQSILINNNILLNDFLIKAFNSNPGYLKSISILYSSNHFNLKEDKSCESEAKSSKEIKSSLFELKEIKSSLFVLSLLKISNSDSKIRISCFEILRKLLNVEKFYWLISNLLDGLDPISIFNELVKVCELIETKEEENFLILLKFILKFIPYLISLANQIVLIIHDSDSIKFLVDQINPKSMIPKVKKQKQVEESNRHEGTTDLRHEGTIDLRHEGTIELRHEVDSFFDEITRPEDDLLPSESLNETTDLYSVPVLDESSSGDENDDDAFAYEKRLEEKLKRSTFIKRRKNRQSSFDYYDESFRKIKESLSKDSISKQEISSDGIPNDEISKISISKELTEANDNQTLQYMQSIASPEIQTNFLDQPKPLDEPELLESSNITFTNFKYNKNLESLDVLKEEIAVLCKIPIDNIIISLEDNQISLGLPENVVSEFLNDLKDKELIKGLLIEFLEPSMQESRNGDFENIANFPIEEENIKLEIELFINSSKDFYDSNSLLILSVSYKILLLFFKDIINSLKSINENCQNENDQKRILRIVRNLHILFDGTAKPTIETLSDSKLTELQRAELKVCDKNNMIECCIIAAEYCTLVISLYVSTLKMLESFETFINLKALDLDKIISRSTEAKSFNDDLLDSYKMYSKQ